MDPTNELTAAEVFEETGEVMVACSAACSTLGLGPIRPTSPRERRLSVASFFGDDAERVLARERLHLLEVRRLRAAEEPAPGPSPSCRAVPRAREHRPARHAAAAGPSGESDGEPPRALRPFIEALADLIVADLMNGRTA
jgi:hypothetical protein